MHSHTSEENTSLQNPYAPFLHEITKPARYIGGEHFLRRKTWTNKMAKIALCFPEVYEIGMSHLGMKILYKELNDKENLLAERCFAPWMDMEKEMRDRNLKLVTLESFRPLCDFDIVGFSLQYELTYTNILMMLELGGITLKQEERLENEPFVIAGGPSATHPEPIAPFLDIVLIGDGEELFAKLATFIKEKREQKISRKEILRDLSTWEGIYIPSLLNNSSVKRHIIQDIKKYPFPVHSPIPHATAIFDKFAIELSRGCTEGCRFCQAGIIYRPVRERSPQEVKKAILTGIKDGGFKEASLTCLSTADYSAVTPLIIDLLDELSKENTSLGIASLRAYGLNEKVLDKMAEVKNTSLTFAPEAGTDRMRKVINKNITEEDILNTAHKVFTRGWTKMKLYFMIGLPFETDDDVKGIMETAYKVKMVGKKLGVKNPQITVSVSSFVPKPHTPFQWAEMISLEEIERKQEMLFQLAREYKLNFRKHFSRTSLIEGVFSRGGRELAPCIEDAYNKGARFDAWEEKFDFNLWNDVLQKNGISSEDYLKGKDLEAPLSWSHIDIGVSEKFLKNEWKKAEKLRESPPCGKTFGELVHYASVEELTEAHDIQKKKIVCYHCGIKCDLTEMVSERKDFLGSLQAHSKDNFVSEPKEKPLDVLSQREKRGAFVGYKYRIKFCKLGPLAYISHLDLQKVVLRILKRTGIETLYSEGYNKRALVSFGPALPLGINSLCEYFDMRVADKIENLEETLKDINLLAETGLVFKSIEEIEKKTLSIQESTREIQYLLFLEKSTDQKSAQDKIQELLQNSTIQVPLFNKKEKKEELKDVRSMIKNAYLKEISFNKEEHDLIHEISPVTQHGVIFEIEAKSGVSLRPSEILFLANKINLPVTHIMKANSVLENC